MILMIDNYDSFTFNLVQYLGELGATLHVARNDALSLDVVEAMQPSHIVISPGPGSPADAGLSCAIIKRFHRRVPMLGVCLGHQCMGQVFEGCVTRASRQMHGKTSPILHDGSGIFSGLPSPFEATRYHSLIVQAPLPAALEATAFTAEGELMGLRHKQFPMFGVQFHPESILTTTGKQLLGNFLAL